MSAHQPDSIETHLSVVLAAPAVSRFIEHTTGWSVRKFVGALVRLTPMCG